MGLLCCHRPCSESSSSTRLHVHRSTCGSLWNMNPGSAGDSEGSSMAEVLLPEFPRPLQCYSLSSWPPFPVGTLPPRTEQLLRCFQHDPEALPAPSAAGLGAGSSPGCGSTWKRDKPPSLAKGAAGRALSISGMRGNLPARLQSSRVPLFWGAGALWGGNVPLGECGTAWEPTAPLISSQAV